MTTIRDVASKAGVSVSTVSRVLNDRDGVSRATYERVRRVIEELNYTSSLAARSMRSHHTHVIGLVVPDLSNSFSNLIIRGVNAAIGEADYGLLVYTSGCRLNEDGILHEQRQVALLNSALTDGTIVVTPRATAFSLSHPVVVIDPNCESSNMPAVLSTNWAGAVAAMEYLIQLGHRRIGLIQGRSDLHSAARRLQGYLDSLEQHGIPYDESLVCAGDFTRETGYRCGCQLLGLAHPPTAIFAANDESAIGAMGAARDAGLGIPADLSVVGFDNITESAWTTPKLTTVDQSLETMGYSAARLLFDLIQGRPVEELIRRLPTKLIVRESCQPPVLEQDS
jgi:LacI family transcriptional regulator